MKRKTGKPEAVMDSTATIRDMIKTSPPALDWQHLVNYHAQYGWHFVMLKGKRPISKGWQHGGDSLNAVLKYKGNIAVLTGQQSRGLVVVDLDPGSVSEGMELPETVTVQTGRGGRHLYYHADESLKNSVGNINEHIDFRADGGCVVFPGAIHPQTQQVYEFLPGHGPDEIKIAPLPCWIAEIHKPEKKPERETGNVHCHGSGSYGNAALTAELEQIRAAPVGQRNHVLNSASFALGQLVGGANWNAR